MDEAQEKDMDAIASFKCGKSLIITSEQERISMQMQSRNLLVSSNRYGYVFYATENDGLAIISSNYIDQQSRYLTKVSEDDDDDDDNNNQENNDKPSIVYRSYIPGEQLTNNSSVIPMWIALNADESILAVVLMQIDSQYWIILFYDAVKLIQIPNSQPICSPVRLSGDGIGDAIQHFTWNPAIPNVFAYIDGMSIVSIFQIDHSAKQLKPLSRSNATNDYSSICWSQKGKQLAVVTYEGALDLYDTNMNLKTQYRSSTDNGTYPPCISVLWLSTYQFLLGYSNNSPDENSSESPYFHLLITFDKDQNRKVQIYNDLFFDCDEASPNLNSQYFYLRLNETQIIMIGLTKSMKINVLGPNELHQDSLDIWSFDDRFRATIINSSNNNDERPILTGMALGLNSTLQFCEGNRKLPPCPAVYLANNQGLLQVYYFVHKTLPTICRKAEVIKASQISQATASPANEIPFLNFEQVSTTANANTFDINEQISAHSSSNFNLQTLAPFNGQSRAFNVDSQPSTPANSQSNGFNFNSQSLAPITNRSNTANFSSSTESPLNAPSKSVQQQSTITTVTTDRQQQPAQTENNRLFQLINDFQSKLESVQNPIPNPSESTVDIESLFKTLQDMNEAVQTSIQSIKHMTNEHMESMPKIEDARHRIKQSQKENLFHSLKNRELDPWTQSRLDTIKTKYDRIKADLDLLLQITHTVIHVRSNHDNNDDIESHEDFLPELEISINENETMKEHLQKRLSELSRQVIETEKDLENICSKLKSDILSDTTFNKTTTQASSSSTAAMQSFHAFDADILSYLHANHRKIQQIQIPPPAVMNINSTGEQEKSTIIEIPKPTTSLVQPSTPKQTDSTTVESEGFKNMLRLVRTSIDLFSGALSPEQLRELSNTITTSPLSSVRKSNTSTINKTSTIPKSTTLTRTTIMNDPLQTQASLPTTNPIQTPGKSVESSMPIISVTPATPANQTMSSNAAAAAALRNQPNKPIVQTSTDSTKSQTISSTGDSVIRSLLDNTTSSLPTTRSVSSQSIFTSTQSQISNAQTFNSTYVVSTTPASTSVASTPTSVQPAFGAFASPATTITTAVQSTMSTTKPIMSTGSSSFGTTPTFIGAPAINRTETGIGFGTATATATAASATPTATVFLTPSTSTANSYSSFGSGFSAALPTTTTAPTASATPAAPAFGIPLTSTVTSSSPFGSGFGTSTTATSNAPTADIFRGTAASAAPATGIFGSATTSTAPTTNMFGGSTTSASGPFVSGFGGSGIMTTSPFGGTSSAAGSTPTPSPFGNTFAGAPSTAPTNRFGGGGSSIFGGASSSTSTPTTSVFGGGSTSAFGGTATATSAAPPSFGGAPVFGSNFAGFGVQSAASTPSSGFRFGGFGGQPTNPSATTGFGSFGSPTASAQGTSPSSGSVFGTTVGQPTTFGGGPSLFGSPTTQPTSPSFTSYRK